MDISQLKACDLANLGSPPQAEKFRTFDPKYRQKFLKGSRLNRDLEKNAVIVVLSGTLTRIPDREGFSIQSILTDFGRISIFKMALIFGALNQSIWSIFTRKCVQEVCHMFLTPVLTN